MKLNFLKICLALSTLYWDNLKHEQPMEMKERRHNEVRRKALQFKNQSTYAKSHIPLKYFLNIPP